MKNFLLLLITLLLSISACSDSKVEDHVWKEQTDTIDKAKEIEQQIKDANLQQQQKIDEQSR